MIPHPGRPRGFTLIELMCSMAIGAIILLAAASLLGSSGEGYERVGGGVATEREARAIMTQLSEDLSTAVHHEDGEFDASSSSWGGGKLGFLTLQAADAQTEEGRIGDLCAVNYYVKDLEIAGRTVRCLMRGFRESDETFSALGTSNISSLFTAKPDIDEPVAFGVVAFEARPKSRDNSGKWVDWQKNKATGPEALDVKLVIARRGLAGKLKTSADWDGGGNAGKLLGDPAKADRNPNLVTYGTLIRFGHDSNS